MGSIDWKKIGKGALLAVIGAVAGYVTTVVVPALEGSAGAVAAIAPLVSIVANIVLKYIAAKQ